MKKTPFSFDPETHTYTYGVHVVPSCTQVIGNVGLVGPEFVDEELLEYKSQLGTEVHLACHLFNQGKQSSVDPKVEPYLDSWIKFHKQMYLHVMRSEHLQIGMIEGMPFGMKVDVQGEVNGHDTIIDIKTGVVYPHHALQLAGYAAGLDDPMYLTPTARFRKRRRMVVQVQSTGKIAKVTRFGDLYDYEIFRSALCVAYWKKSHEKIYPETNI
jgi:hypothetical protein